MATVDRLSKSRPAERRPFCSSKTITSMKSLDLRIAGVHVTE